MSHFTLLPPRPGAALRQGKIPRSAFLVQHVRQHQAAFSGVPDYIQRAIVPAYIRGAIVDVEIKNLPGEADFDSADRIADAVVALLGERPEPTNSWLISSFRRETIDRCRAVDPGIATGWLTIGAVTDEEIAWGVDAGHAAIHPWDPTVDRRLVDRCHHAGLHVNTWTCNDVARAVELASWGIDGICTDVPDVLVDALAS